MASCVADAEAGLLSLVELAGLLSQLQTTLDDGRFDAAETLSLESRYAAALYEE
jgi:hypothetical protein